MTLDDVKKLAADQFIVRDMTQTDEYKKMTPQEVQMMKVFLGNGTPYDIRPKNGSSRLAVSFMLDNNYVTAPSIGRDKNDTTLIGQSINSLCPKQ